MKPILPIILSLVIGCRAEFRIVDTSKQPQVDALIVGVLLCYNHLRERVSGESSLDNFGNLKLLVMGFVFSY